MAEVAASAAGLASLGIQCCKGLTTYYNSYKAYDEQTGATLEQIQVVTTLFENLERVLSRNAANPTQVSHLQQVDRILNLCQGRIQKLQSVLEKCQGVALPSNTSDAWRRIKSQALFPFREQTLLTLRDNVQSLVGDLQLALNILHLYVSTHIRLLGVAHIRIPSDLNMEQNQSTADLAAISRTVESVTQKTQSDIQAIAVPIHRMNTSLDPLLEQGEDTKSRLSDIQIQMQQHHEEYRVVLQNDRTTSHNLVQELITQLGQSGVQWELHRNAITSSEQKREDEARELAMAMRDLIAGKPLGSGWVSHLSWQTGLSHEIILNSLVSFCEKLCALGVPPNWLSYEENEDRRYRRLFVDDFVQNAPSHLDPGILSHALNRLCDRGLELTSSTLGFGPPEWPKFPGRFRTSPIFAFHKCDDVIEGLCRNGIHEAIFHRSAAGLQAALENQRTSVHDSNENGDTPLHLACNWPPGMSMLLAHGADMEKTDRFGTKPIVFAIFDSTRKRNILQLAVAYLRISTSEPFSRKSHSDYFEIVKKVIKELASRRGYTKASVVDEPGVNQSEHSRLDNDQLYNSSIPRAENSAPDLRRGNPQSRGYFHHMHTVYHCPYLNVEIADELWNAGFRDVDMPDEYGRTPLMILRPWWLEKSQSLREYLDCASWLHQKGASLHRPCDFTFEKGSNNIGDIATRSKRYGIHYAAATLGSILYYVNIYLTTRANTITRESLSLDIQQFLRKLPLDDSLDDCICVCSEHGCLPITNCLKKYSLFLYYDPRGSFSAYIFCRLLEVIPAEGFPNDVSRELVRLATFQKLGLRHTCCKFDPAFNHFVTIEPKETDEIRDEDHEGIQLLESLLEEFEEKRGNEDIKSFLNGYWATRMEEVLEGRDKEMVDRAAMREVGVIMMIFLTTMAIVVAMIRIVQTVDS
ncbi:MAG: hypothetical protein Q9216_003945 [Gyalolechia sp. 2 TL-2023]